MRHLFVVNPAAGKVKGKVSALTRQIHDFFVTMPDIPFEVYVTEWCCDAMTYVRKVITEMRETNDDTIRVHTLGGTGTLFEIVNGVIGLPGVEVAAYPFGKADAFLRYFGKDKLACFSSIEGQVFGKSIPIDAIRCGGNYGICYGIAGLEALCDLKGDAWAEKGMPVDMSYVIASIPLLLGRQSVAQDYRIEIDGVRYDGRYLSVFIANIPCYGQNLYPGIEAHPDDGLLEIYLLKDARKLSTLYASPNYLKGKYKKIKEIEHISGKHIKLSSDNTIFLNIDSQSFYGTTVEYELLPGAVNFVCPDGVDIKMLPRIYNKPKEGLRCD